MRKYLKEGQYSIDQDDTLGKGSFGKVYRGYDHTNSYWVAIKSINLQLLEIHGAEMKTIICNQITVMRKFTKQMQQQPCPYLVKHYDCFRTDTHVYIVMQLCEGGTLNDLLNKGDIAEEEVKTILKQIISGLQYLDALNISHRDLKPQNIFVAVDFLNGKNIKHYKIGDFGFAAQKQSFTEVLGTYPFMAPEIYKRENYTSKVDVWSLGIIAYQLLFKELYFFGKNKWEIEKKVKQVQFVLEEKKRRKISDEMYEFISVCLTKDKEKRPNAAQLFQLPLFAQQEKHLLIIFEALELQLFYCELLRSMAEEICQFGNSTRRGTEFIQIYLLKRAYSIVNLLNYSLMNKQNYLNIDNDQFQVLTNEKYKKQFAELYDKVQKQSILVTALFQDKYAAFQKYIDKFGLQEKDLILSIIAAQKHYQDINASVFKTELKKWADLLSNKDSQYQTLRLKFQKLLQL